MEAGKYENGTEGRKSGGHSADVRIRLRVGDESFVVSQVGGGRLTFAQPVFITGDSGELQLSIDGSEQCWPVNLNCPREASPVVEVVFGRGMGENGDGHFHQIDGR